jgi:hypothetical protein
MLLLYRQRIALGLSSMTGIDLTGVRDKIRIERRRPIAGLRSYNGDRGGRCEYGGRDAEDVAFHGELLWLDSEIIAKGPSKMPARRRTLRFFVRLYAPLAKHCVSQ